MFIYFENIFIPCKKPVLPKRSDSADFILGSSVDLNINQNEEINYTRLANENMEIIWNFFKF